MGNTVLESTGLVSTQKRIRYCVSGTYICDGIEHINVTLSSTPSVTAGLNITSLKKHSQRWRRWVCTLKLPLPGHHLYI